MADRGRIAGAPTVSVVIPTHQRRALVGEAVKSVLAQTYEDFELIVVDDGSGDGTRHAVDGLDPRIRYLWQRRRGPAAARNVGLRCARGSILAFLDSDNLWARKHLEALVGALERHPEADLAYVGIGRSDGRMKVEQPLVGMLAGNIVSRTSGVAMRREAALMAGGFDERLGIAEDADLWMRLALRGSRFVRLPRQTVIRRTVASSTLGGRRGGEYSAAVELATVRAIDELDEKTEGGESVALAGARGRRALLAAVRALPDGDRDRLRGHLEEACRLLPDLDARPHAVASHVRFDLDPSAPRSTLARRLVALAAAWPRPDSPVARMLGAQAVIEALLGARPVLAGRLLRETPTGPLRSVVVDLRRAARTRLRAERWSRRERLRGVLAQPRELAVRAQRLLIGIADGPAAPVAHRAYEALARAVARHLVARTGAVAYVRGSLGSGDAIYGLSDIDLAVVLPEERSDAAASEVWRRWHRLRRLLPRLSRLLLEPPRLYRPEELEASTLRHGLEREPLRPSSRERWRERGGAERPGLYGPGWDWRRIAGPAAAEPPREWPDQRELWAAAWMELQYWWLQAFRASDGAAAPWGRQLCAKLVLEPARVWLWVAHRKRPRDDGELADAVGAMLPEQAEVLRAALEVRRSAASAAHPPLETALASLTLSTELVAAELTAAGEAGASEVRLLGGRAEIVGEAEAGAVAALGLSGARALPLVDWRARVRSAPPDEAFVPIDGALDSGLLGAIAHDDAGSYAAIRDGALLVLPSLKRARLRAVQCPATDPVSFALLDGLDVATFPGLPGWSARDCARRAVAEHLGWLGGLDLGAAGGPDPMPATEGLITLGRLFTAARALHFLATVDAGEPELDLTAEAIAARMGSWPAVGRALADGALAELGSSSADGGPPSKALVAALRDGVWRCYRGMVEAERIRVG